MVDGKKAKIKAHIEAQIKQTGSPEGEPVVFMVSVFIFCFSLPSFVYSHNTIFSPLQIPLYSFGIIFVF